MSFQFFLLVNTTLIVMVSMIPDLVPSMPPYNFRGLLSFTIVFSASYFNVLAAYFSCSVFPPLCSLSLTICPLPFPSFSCFPLEAATAIALNWFPVSSPGVLSLLSFFVVQLGSTLAELRFELLFHVLRYIVPLRLRVSRTSYVSSLSILTRSFSWSAAMADLAFWLPLWRSWKF